jgi:hypothetical protein
LLWPCHMRAPTSLAVTLLLAMPVPAPALAPPVGFSLETAVSAGPGGSAPRLTAVTSCWLAGDLEAEARLALGSAPRSGGRGADAVTPGLGLRWAPDPGRWRPLLGLEAGVRLPAAGGAAAPTAAARAGVEFFPLRQLWLSLAIGWRRTAGAAPGAEAALGIGYAP